ncbi:hypothetical protein X777_13169, partial [Ooceraea biroi]
GGEMEEKKREEDSPGDLRYETLIKIISSASVGCRDAYTTASRECNDLNGNNSVKDGCSRCPFPMRALQTRRCGPTLRTRRQEKNSRMDTSSRTKSVERPVRAVDLFIASLDALTLLGGSSTLSARIDSDERATLLASFGWPVCRTNREAKRERERERKTGEKRSCSNRADAKEKREPQQASPQARTKREEKRQKKNPEVQSADSSNILHGPDEKDRARRTEGGRADPREGRNARLDDERPRTMERVVKGRKKIYESLRRWNSPDGRDGDSEVQPSAIAGEAPGLREPYETVADQAGERRSAATRRNRAPLFLF